MGLSISLAQSFVMIMSWQALHLGPGSSILSHQISLSQMPSSDVTMFRAYVSAAAISALTLRLYFTYGGIMKLIDGMR